MNRYKLIGLALFLVVAFLAACIPGGAAFSPESAATQELDQHHNAIAESVRIHQSQPWRGNSIVMASYLSIEQNEQWSCEAVFEMQRIATGWQVSGSGNSCSNPPNIEAVTSGSGTQGMPPDDLSYAHGLVKLNAAKWVEITWQDGTLQRTAVVNGSYLALRAGSFQMIASVEVLDAAEKVIHEIEIMPDVQKIP
ncbi:MAG: hypothetical protein KJ638_03055 [Chloroflexi bacterium]|nr:hypothetical protein [Chloroflexota bacterium]